MKNKRFGRIRQPDGQKIVLKLHYHRSDGNYQDWNAWIWTTAVAGKSYPLREEDGVMTATFTVDSRYTTAIRFILRKGEWAAQEFGQRQIDVSTLASGTVHYYVESGVEAGRMALSQDSVITNKILYAELDYDTGFIHIRTAAPIVGDPREAVRLVDVTGSDGSVAITSISAGERGYALRPNKPLELTALYRYKLRFQGVDFKIGTTLVYGSKRFDREFVYQGDDLGCTWTREKTTFKVWAPTAEGVMVALYRTGDIDRFDRLGTVELVRQDQGVWSGTFPGDHSGMYYTYLVMVDGNVVEAVDPYARTTGVNGARAQILDPGAAQPAGWAKDRAPGELAAYTDAVVYELHVRDASIHPASGITHKGKFLGLTEEHTLSPGGRPTGLDYLKMLGITHLQLMPVFDYGTVNEAQLQKPQFNWGYDPVNYNVPEGSYSTDPYDGRVRVRELKTLIKALHDSGIRVIMDVVYNHVYETEDFSFNQIVPGYFSRKNGDGSWSNGSGCGNDTASERPMVRKFIIDSILYWVREYHIDGFRFDLVGLLDTKTVNALVEAAHQIRPDVIFFGEGWTLPTAVAPGNFMATQPNAHMTPDFGYFSDNIRDLLAGENGRTTGFASGLTGREDSLFRCYFGDVWWCPGPTQTVNYVSCHDNYTLMDKLCLTRPDVSREDRIRMGRLCAAIYLTAQGIPFIHAGEELLREKLDSQGRRVENSYNAPDTVNAIDWRWVDQPDRWDTAQYYAGLIAFRKAHAALRQTAKDQVSRNIRYRWITNELVLFELRGKEAVPEETAQGILALFNARPQAMELDLYAHGVGEGPWKVFVNGERAGTQPIETIAGGKVKLAPISAMILVKE